MADVTDHEIARRLDKIDNTLETKMVTTDVFQGEQRFRDKASEDQDKRITKLDESLTWAFRLMIGSFLAIVLEGVLIVLRMNQP